MAHKKRLKSSSPEIVARDRALYGKAITTSTPEPVLSHRQKRLVTWCAALMLAAVATMNWTPKYPGILPEPAGQVVTSKLLDKKRRRNRRRWFGDVG